MKYIREHPDELRAALSHRGESVDLDKILDLDREARNLIQEVEALRARRNQANERIHELKEGQGDVAPLIAEMKNLSTSIKGKDGQLAELKKTVKELLLWVPNIPHGSVPVGKDETANVEIRTWGKPPEFDFEPLDHLELGHSLGVFDFVRAAKISGSGFPLYTGKGAMLERSLINFMLDHHVERGYKEVSTPYMALRPSTEATGQLPKLEDDMYRCERDDFFL
ncbi:MAG: serine--tRNA ligase, partial [Fidelibacterota bacterium]